MRPRILLLIPLVALAGLGLPRQTTPNLAPPAVVRLPAGNYTYRPAGEFRLGTQVVDAPLQREKAATDLHMMKYQVTEADYARCIAAAACPDLGAGTAADMAQTGVNFTDATAYAAWFSEQTGRNWRLPTDAEWMRAAKGRAFDDGLSQAADDKDPAHRWLASYRREAALRGTPDATRHPIGSVPESDFRLADMAGNVWEWTTTCFQNGIVTPDGRAITHSTDYCGVHAVQGKHRAFVIDFVRDARSGGCAAGVPPDYLGFRLVRED